MVIIHHPRYINRLADIYIEKARDDYEMAKDWLFRTIAEDMSLLDPVYKAIDARAVIRGVTVN